MSTASPAVDAAVPATVGGMGSIVHEHGVAFRVWAPHADRVWIMGEFNAWTPADHEMTSENNGYWYLDVDIAKPGQQYKYRIKNGDQTFDRIDPYAREVTNSVGSSLIVVDDFDWGDDDFCMPSWNEIVIYELHVGTFARRDPDTPGTFDDAIQQLPHLQKLGVNVLQIMPIAEFAGDLSWGYNPAHIFAVEQAYGGPTGLKKFIQAAHQAGFAVLIDVVYNHFGPSDLDLWQFDGWSENEKGGIYFYNDHRSVTPWGDTRPDYGRGEVRQFIHDNAMMWMRDYHADGLRYDMTAYIRTISGIGDDDISEGWTLMQWINQDLSQEFPGCLLVAEDLQKNDYLTKPVHHGGAGFSTQWDAAFVHPVRETVQQVEDDHRSMVAIRDALCHRYNLDVFERTIYSESHDEVANGKARVPQEIDPENPTSPHAQKRSTIAAALALTAPGIPMLFQGQELLVDEWFRDTHPLDWERAEEFRGITRLYRDLIHLRLNRFGHTRGLTGQHIHVHHINEQDKVMAYCRSKDAQPGDEVVVVINFANQAWEDYVIGLPQPGHWQVRFNSDWSGYSDAFDDTPSPSIEANTETRDGLPASARIQFGAYSVLILSQVPL